MTLKTRNSSTLSAAASKPRTPENTAEFLRILRHSLALVERIDSKIDRLEKAVLHKLLKGVVPPGEDIGPAGRDEAVIKLVHTDKPVDITMTSEEVRQYSANGQARIEELRQQGKLVEYGAYPDEPSEPLAKPIKSDEASESAWLRCLALSPYETGEAWSNEQVAAFNALSPEEAHNILATPTNGCGRLTSVAIALGMRAACIKLPTYDEYMKNLADPGTAGES